MDVLDSIRNEEFVYSTVMFFLENIVNGILSLVLLSQKVVKVDSKAD